MSGAAFERRLRRVNNDSETRAIIYDGASINQIAAMFGMGNTEVASKLRHLAPVGIRSGYPIYKVKEAAEYLLKPRVDIEAYVRKVGVKDFPPALQKDLWAAMNGQLKFEEAQGDVWRTERIQTVWAEWIKVVRMTLLLAPDEAEREGWMRPEQYEHFRAFIDRLLETLYQNVVDAMNNLDVQKPGIVEYVEADADEADDDTQAAALDEDDEEL